MCADAAVGCPVLALLVPDQFPPHVGWACECQSLRTDVLVSMRQVSPPALVVGLSAIQFVAQPARSVIVGPCPARESNGRSETRRWLFCVWPMTTAAPIVLNSAVFLHRLEHGPWRGQRPQRSPAPQLPSRR